MNSTAIATAGLLSLLCAGLLVLTATHHGRFSMDVPGHIQTFHSQPTPRIGGLAIYLALVAALWLVRDETTRQIIRTLLIAGLPALSVGLGEDMTRRVGVLPRLLATASSGWLAWWSTGISVTQIGIPPVDAALSIGLIAMLFTALAVAGVANAINIIDGFHGLASGTTTICLLALAAIASSVGDGSLMLAATIVAAAMAGFWLVNFPWGKLFLGDGGAYFAGFALAWLAVLLPARNASVSPWASLMVCAYPVIEVIYSVWRRRRVQRPAGQADREHLHSLVAISFVKRRLPLLHPTLQNATVSVLMWAIAAVPALIAMVLFNHTYLLMISAAGCLVLYHLLYRRVARHEQ